MLSTILNSNLPLSDRTCVSLKKSWLKKKVLHFDLFLFGNNTVNSFLE